MTAADELAAIAIAPNGLEGPLRVLVERLVEVGVAVEVVEDVPSAASLWRGASGAPPCVLLDLRDVGAGSELEDVKLATGAIRRVCEALPRSAPIAITGEADAGLIIACIRAGAGDVIDLRLEGTAVARAVLQRVALRQRERASELALASELRALIEELLKDLIRTERRSIDLEEQLAARRRSGEVQTVHAVDARMPSVLVVDSARALADDLAERLEVAGVATFAYATGEDAVHDVDALVAADGGIDLALVAVELPGIDGLETVRQLRRRSPGLPAFLMTATHDAKLAADAADLGVVGFVHKPLADADELVARLVGLAREALQHTREHVYLERIKTRHDRVLARYRRCLANRDPRMIAQIDGPSRALHQAALCFVATADDDLPARSVARHDVPQGVGAAGDRHVGAGRSRDAERDRRRARRRGLGACPGSAAR